MKRSTTMFMALALSAVLLTAQDKAPAKPAATPAAADDPVVMASGSLSIRQSEFEAALKSLPAEYQQFAMGPGKRQFAEDFLRMKLLAAEGMKAGLDKDPDVQNQLKLMRENLVANAQLTKIESAIKVTDEDLKKVYDASKNQYEQVEARHILIAFKGSAAAQPGKKELTEDEAKAKAEELRTKIAGGAKFEDVAKAESDDTGSGTRGGELGSFGRGQMVPEFEKAAFEAKVGEMTPVVRTQYGYHIIKVDKHDHTPFEQVKSTLERSEKQKKLQEKLDAMKSAANTTFNEKYFEGAPKPEGSMSSTDAPTPAPNSEAPVPVSGSPAPTPVPTPKQ